MVAFSFNGKMAGGSFKERLHPYLTMKPFYHQWFATRKTIE